MPIQKLLLHRLQPISLYVILILSVCYFSVQLILSHFTHALTLLMASYHMLCNIFALTGSIVSIKHNELYGNNSERSHMDNGDKNLNNTTDDLKNGDTAMVYNGNVIKQETKKESSVTIQFTEEEATLTESRRQEQKTRNTFGWARVEILTIVIVCITLASLSFSLLVEALQTLVHIDHQDSMHLPIHVMILGFVGLILNILTYTLIGGYTLHQGHISRVISKCTLDEKNIQNSGNLQIESKSNVELHLKAELKHEIDGHLHHTSKKQGASELLRDISSTIFVIVCGVIVHFAQDKEHTAKFIDPVLSIFSCVLVVALSYPYMKESCLILLQTIPDTINLEDFENSLIKKFPQIVTYHDLHIWQLSSLKYIATVHIVFHSPELYQKSINDVHAHFKEHRIAHVTIQPEFYTEGSKASSSECLMQCTEPDCMNKVCCKDSLSDIRDPNQTQSVNNKSSTNYDKTPCEKYIHKLYNKVDENNKRMHNDIPNCDHNGQRDINNTESKKNEPLKTDTSEMNHQTQRIDTKNNTNNDNNDTNC